MKRALVVIDAQYEYVDGALPISYPPLSTSLPNIARAMDAAAEAGVAVVLVEQRAPHTSPIFGSGTRGAEIIDDVKNRHHDLVVTKTLPSSFTGTALDEWLRARNIDTVAVAGYMTQNCVESTARDAVHRGYRVEFLEDAAGTLDMQNEVGTISAHDLHHAVSVVLHSRFAATVTTSAWCSAVKSCQALTGSTIPASMRPQTAR